MAKQVCDIRGSAGMSRGQSTEHLRNYKVTDPNMKKYGYYDPTRMRLNFEVVDGGKIIPVNQSYPLDKRLKDNMKARGITPPKPIQMKDGTKKDRLSVANIILGGSRNQMLQLAFGDQKVDLKKNADNSHLQRKEDIESWAVAQYNLMCKLYGKENVIAFVVHLDEKNPHVHCTILPEKDGKISYNSVIGGKNKEEAREHFLKTHDAVAEVNSQFGLERGNDVRLTGAKHRTSEEYWTYLRDECSRLENQVGSLEDQVESLNEQIKFVEDEIRRANIKHKSFTTMIANQEKALEDLNNEVNTEEYLLQENQNQNNNLTTLIQNKQKMLREKKEQLEETDEKLLKLKEKYQELLQQKNDLEKQVKEKRNELNNTRQDELDRLERDLFSQFGRYLTYLPNMIGKQLEELKNTMTFDQREMFDKMMSRTFLKEMTENTEDIIRTAASLYLGQPSQETMSALHTGALITPTAGSGGGGSGNGWKKKPDEDDDTYKYRCVAMACMVAKRKRSLRR